jgi:uncharacterized membrane protein YqaE (UPF0057 family)
MRKAVFTLVTVFLVISTTATVTPPPTIDPDPKTAKAIVKTSIQEWKSLTRKERKGRVKLAKKEVKALKAARKSGSAAETNTILLAILAILLPPLAVYLHQGSASTKFVVTLILWILGIIGLFLVSGWFLLASVIYALLVVLDVV